MAANNEASKQHWTTIVITCVSRTLREGLQEECDRLSKGGLLPSHDNLIVVEDPQAHTNTEGDEQKHSAGVGSGGATINAILVAVERLSAQRHHTTIESEVIRESRVLVVHIGRVIAHSPGGTVMLRVDPELSCVPNHASTTPPTLLQHTIWMTTKLSENTVAGVWVTSLDSFIPSSSCLVAPVTKGINGALLVTLEATLSQAALHGVVITHNNGLISNMKFRMPRQELESILKGESAQVISGVVFLSVDLTERLLSLHTHPPLDRCTYYGTDSGVPPLQMSLYFDLLLPLCDEAVYEDYVNGIYSAAYNKASSYTSTSYQEACSARMQIWTQLNGLRATNHHLKGIKHHYISSNSSFCDSIMPLLPKTSVSFGHENQNSDNKNSGTIIVNGYIDGFLTSEGGTSVIIDSWIGASFDFKGPCILTGLRIFGDIDETVSHLPGGCVWQGYPTEIPQYPTDITQYPAEIPQYPTEKRVQYPTEDKEPQNPLDLDIQTHPLTHTTQKYPTEIQKIPQYPTEKLVQYPTEDKEPQKPLDLNIHTEKLAQYRTEKKQDLPPYVLTCHGIFDILTAGFSDPNATIFNQKWDKFFTRTEIKAEDLWSRDTKDRSLITATLFPAKIPAIYQIELVGLLVRTATGLQSNDKWLERLEDWRGLKRVSLLGLARNCNLKQVVKWQEEIYIGTVQKMILDTADDMKGNSLLPVFRYIVTRSEGQVKKLVSTLHELLIESRPSTSRLLANVADLLGCLAANQGGLRSGPAANPQWRNALHQLKTGNQREGVEMMLEVCEKWMKSGNAEDLIRAARHYERASQIIISKQVETAGKHVWWWQKERKIGLGVIGKGVWVEANCPARLDLAGGWSDTPPICYEQGGAVLNVAIKVNKKKPISARVRIIPELQIVCVLRDWCGGEVRLTWTDLKQLCDYDNPVARGALVKAVLLYCRVLDTDTDETLISQLKQRYGGGIEVEIWSQLPQGSGLGGSSLVAGSFISAVIVLLGYTPPTHKTLLHATLCIEQWLTTGGGWQDQVGGLIGGVKLGMSGQISPVTISSYKIPISRNFLDVLNSHLMLLYTGKVRLARNLLQTVIRNWYARDPIITSCFSQLRQLAVKAAGAVLDEDLKALGSCIDDYWGLKKMVASGCEPIKVTALMSTLKTHCYGMSLAGAGGGGYMYALKTNPNSLNDIQLGDLVCDEVEVDDVGLEVRVGGELMEIVQDDQEILTKEKWLKL